MATHVETRPVFVGLGEVGLQADLAVPDPVRGLVLFAHGSGSSRFSPRNREVAGRLNQAGFATLLLDLFTDVEEREDAATRALRFDVDLLAERLAGTIDWLGRDRVLGALPLGLFGASTGAAGALAAAAARPDRVRAVVSRGGRPDLAGPALVAVRAPTLLLVGGEDQVVLGLNREAQNYLRSQTRLVIIPGAGHLFEEPGALEQVSGLAAAWFDEHLAGLGVAEPLGP